MIRWKLKELIDARGVSLYRVSKDSGVSYGVVHRLYHNPEAERVDGHTLARLCRYFGLEPGGLLEYVEEGNASKDRMPN